MGESLEQTRSNALSFDRSQIIQVYLKSSGLKQQYFMELIREARLCFVNGCPRASITVSGEALIRALLFKLRQLYDDGKVSSSKESIRRLLADDLSFDKAIGIFEGNKLFDTKITELMTVVRHLRNRATHGELPVVDDWDPEEGTHSEEEIFGIFKGNKQVNEGYKIFRYCNKKHFTFDLKHYGCGSLKGLDPADKIAAIQFFLVIEILSKVYNNTNNLVISPTV